MKNSKKKLQMIFFFDKKKQKRTKVKTLEENIFVKKKT